MHGVERGGNHIYKAVRFCLTQIKCLCHCCQAKLWQISINGAFFIANL